MLRLIQAGMGGWGRNWAETVLEPDDNVKLVGCVDADPASLDAARQKLSHLTQSYFSSLSDALNATEADAVLITANLPGHVPLALEALRAGKHVLLEKPFAPSVAEARRVVEAADEQNRVLMISQNYRFFPAVEAVRAIIKSGELGAIGAVLVDFRKYANKAPREGNKHYALFHPLLADMSIHHFDLMRAVLGQEAQEITCEAFNPAWSNFADPAAAFATISFSGGAIVSYRGSWVSPGPQTAWAGEWRIECEGGEISWTSRDNYGASVDRVTVKPLGKRARRVELRKDMVIDRAGSLRAFAEAVAKGEQPESSGRDNLGSIALTYAAIESADTGRTVKL